MRNNKSSLSGLIHVSGIIFPMVVEGIYTVKILQTFKTVSWTRKIPAYTDYYFDYYYYKKKTCIYQLLEIVVLVLVSRLEI